jgi:hypothetical protein
MSPWRYKKATEIMSPAAAGCSLKAEAMLGAPRVAFLASPLGQRGEDEGEGVGAPQLPVALINPHPPLSLRKGEATRCTYGIPSA